MTLPPRVFVPTRSARYMEGRALVHGHPRECRRRRVYPEYNFAGIPREARQRGAQRPTLARISDAALGSCSMSSPPATIVQRVEQLRRELHEHDYRYYVLAEPTISDE